MIHKMTVNARMGQEPPHKTDGANNTGLFLLFFRISSQMSGDNKNFPYHKADYELNTYSCSYYCIRRQIPCD